MKATGIDTGNTPGTRVSGQRGRETAVASREAKMQIESERTRERARDCPRVQDDVDIILESAAPPSQQHRTASIRGIPLWHEIGRLRYLPRVPETKRDSAFSHARQCEHPITLWLCRPKQRSEALHKATSPLPSTFIKSRLIYSFIYSSLSS